MKKRRMFGFPMPFWSLDGNPGVSQAVSVLKLVSYLFAASALFLVGLVSGPQTQAAPPAQSVGPGGITFPVDGTVTLRWYYSCGDDPTDLKSEYGYRLNGVRYSYGDLEPNGSHSCYMRAHTLDVAAGDRLKVWLFSFEGTPEACHYDTRYYAPPADTQSQWTSGSGNLVGTVHWEDMLIGCPGGDSDFDDVLTEISFSPDPPSPPALSLGAACANDPDRTVSWSEDPALEYRVQAAQNAGFSVDLRNSDWISGGSHTFTGLAETTYYYRIQARYGTTAGVWSATESAQQDYTPPTTLATPSGTAGAAGWWISPVTLDLSAVESGCGLQATTYRVDGGAWQTYVGPFAISDEGAHTVIYYSTDVAGNVEVVRTVALQIDTVDPATAHTLSGTPGNAGWWRSDVAVDLSAFDATSGVWAIRYRVGGGMWHTYFGPFAISGEGDHTLEYRSRDVAGNWESDHSVPVRIDTVAPASAITGPSAGDWLSGTVPIAGTASDPTPGSGVVRVDTSRDGGATWHPAGGTTGWATSWDTTAGPDGDYSLGSRADDVAGNRESPGFVPVHVDNTPPETDIDLDGTPGENGWTISPVDVTLAADDGAGVGVRRTDYWIDGGSRQIYRGRFRIESEGIHLLKYRSVDRLGNQGAVETGTVRIDTVAPDTTATPSGVAGENGWWISDVSVDLSAFDATSGVALSEYRVDGGSWQTYSGSFTITSEGNHTIDYHSRDVAGNWEGDETLT
ncbi:MAG: hypothetical protein GF350_06965, partial [Chitinivibrionales bacterium]|nr:hypothetical protein [Chitinivibrionales bacterium]